MVGSVVAVGLALAACAQLRESSVGGRDAGVDADGDGVDAGPLPSNFEIVRGGLPDGVQLNSIWGVDENTLFAVGVDGLHVDLLNGKWIRSQTNPGRVLHHVWGLAADDVYAVGESTGDRKGVIQHFDGTSWRDEYAPDAPVHGVWSDGAAVYAVGPLGRIYAKMIGTTAWGIRANLKEPDVPVLHAIAGNGVNDFALAAERRIYHYRGKGTFAWIRPIVDDSLRFVSAWAPPSERTDVFFGTNYLGIVWMTVPNQLPANAYDAAALLDPDASLDEASLVKLWRDDSFPDGRELFMWGIWGFGPDRIFVGDRGKILSYKGVTGDMRPVASPTDDSLRGVWGDKSGVWIVGSRELILRGPWP